jgi:hypothetical protein
MTQETGKKFGPKLEIGNWKLENRKGELEIRTEEGH